MTAKFQRSFGRKVQEEPPQPTTSETETSDRPESETDVASSPYAYPYTHGKRFS